MKEFKEGDKVICDGVEGVVKRIYHEKYKYPVRVEFVDGTFESFTVEGKMLVAHDHPSLFHADQTSFQDMSIVDILKREGYDTMTDGNKIYVGRDGVVVATLIMRGKG